MSAAGAYRAWRRELRAKHIEERLPPPVLEDSRSIRVHADRIKPSEPHPSRLLRVESDYFVAGAVWEKIGGCWSCTKAAPIIKWMKGKTSDQVKLALIKMGAQYEFLPLSHGASDGVSV